MKKITLFLIMLGFFLTANAQYAFDPIVGPTNVAEGSPVTINLNDVANSAGVPASSSGSYDSFSITLDWSAGASLPYSDEADIIVNTTTGSVSIDPPTTSGPLGNESEVTFVGNFPTVYNPLTDGYLEIILNQSWGGSDANWSNIIVTLFESPTCVVPSGMSTSTLTTTSVDLVWNAGDSETIWNVEYNSGADFTPGNGEEEGSANITGTPAMSLSSLTEATDYYVYYQADCGATDGTSEWVGPFNFFTSYCQSLPTSNDGDGISQVVLGNETFISAGDVFYEDFTSPTVDLAAAITANLQITFAVGNFTDYNTYVYIDFNNDLVYDTATELFYTGLSAAGIPSTLDASFTMPDVPLGVYNMRISTSDFVQNPPNPCFSASWGVTMEFTINVTAAPDCIPPSALVANTITQDAADLTWNGGVTGESWDLEWGPTGFAPGTGTLVTGLTTETYPLTGLTAGTAYDFYVLSNCAASETSTVSGPSTFFTATPGETCADAFPMTVEVDCDTATPTTFNFANAADLQANGEFASCDGFADYGYWVSFTAPAVGSVVFNFSGAAASIGLEVLDACGGTAVSACNNNLLDAGEDSGIIGGLTPGDTYYAVIWRDGQNGTADVCIEEGPTCSFPINLEATNLTDTSADLGWTENGTATSWNIEWGIAGFTPGTGTAVSAITVNPYGISGLTQNTDYDFYVQAICTSEISDFEGPFTFTTTPQTNFVLDCALDGPLTQDYCYGDNDTNVFTFTSTDGTPLNLTFNSGGIESCCDNLLVFDSNGDPLYADNNGGDLSGLSWQSTGDTISFQIDSDGSVSCANGSFCCTESINYTVSCATCINPQATYAVIDDCENGEQFLIDVDVLTLGDALGLTISNNINMDTTPVTVAGVYQIGPFAFGTDVIVTVSNDDDVNCIINSNPIQILACPPANDNPCGATVAVVNDDILCAVRTPGTILAATPSGIPNPSCGGDADNDVWFQFVAQSEYQLIALANITGSNANGLNHSLYEGTCDNLTEIACTEDNFTGSLSSATPLLTIGDTYFIRVYSYDSDDENTAFEICITPYIAPVNIACDVAENYCSGSDENDILYTYNTIGLIPGDGTIDCLFTTPNPTFSLLQIGSSGDLLIEMEQNSAFDENDNPIGSGLDVDFILWGPFSEGDDLCDLGSVVDCSYSAAAIENVTLLGAVQDEVYLLLITNFNRAAGVIQVRQTNVGEPGAGNTVADINAEIVSSEVLFQDVDSDPSTPEEANVCGVPSVVIETNSPFADEFLWLKDGQEIIGETSSSLTVTESNNYQVIATDNQCGSSALSQLVVVNLYMEPDPIAPQTIALCDGPEADGIEDFDLAALSADLAVDGFTISYYTNTSDANSTQNPLPSTYSSAGGETLIIRIEDTNKVANDFYFGCRAFSQVELVVNSRPIVTQPTIEPVCDDLDGSVDGFTDFDLIAINDAVTTETGMNITYHTSQDDADSGDNALPSPYNSDGGTLYARVENPTTLCYETIAFEIEVNIVPLATFDPQYAYQVCPDATVPVTIGLTPTNFAAADVTVQWYQDDVLISGQSGLTLETVLTSGEYSAVIQFNGSGCTNEFISTSVIELDSCIFPEGISPNNDDINDYFDLSSFGVTELNIYNRYGKLVYSKKNYTNEWKGQTNEGNELPVGTYFYTVIYEGGNNSKSAWVYINR